MSALNEWLRKRSAAGLYCMSWLTQAFKIGIGSSAETTMLKSAALSLVLQQRAVMLSDVAA